MGCAASAEHAWFCKGPCVAVVTRPALVLGPPHTVRLGLLRCRVALSMAVLVWIVSVPTFPLHPVSREVDSYTRFRQFGRHLLCRWPHLRACTGGQQCASAVAWQGVAPLRVLLRVLQRWASAHLPAVCLLLIRLPAMSRP